MDRYQKYFKAVGDYTWNEGKDSAREDNEEERQERLSFKIGYIFFVLQDCSSDWVYCKCLDTGDMGFVPTTLIEEVVPVFAVAVKDQTRNVEQSMSEHNLISAIKQTSCSFPPAVVSIQLLS